MNRKTLLSGSIILATTACLVFSGCSKKVSNTPVTNTPAVTTDTSTQESESAITQVESSPVEDNLPVRGHIENDKYINEKMGYCIVLPQDWQFADEEAMKMLNNIADESMKDSEFSELYEQMKDGDSLYETMAMSPDASANIMLAVTKMPEQVDVSGETDVERESKYYDMYLEEIKVGAEKTGAVPGSLKQIDVQLDGDSHLGTVCQFAANGMTGEQMCIHIFRNGYDYQLMLNGYGDIKAESLLPNIVKY